MFDFLPFFIIMSLPVEHFAFETVGKHLQTVRLSSIDWSILFELLAIRPDKPTNAEQNAVVPNQNKTHHNRMTETKLSNQIHQIVFIYMLIGSVQTNYFWIIYPFGVCLIVVGACCDNITKYYSKICKFIFTRIANASQ